MDYDQLILENLSLNIIFESFSDYKNKKEGEGVEIDKINNVINKFKELSRTNKIEPNKKDIGVWMRLPIEDLEEYLKLRSEISGTRDLKKSEYDISKLKNDKDIDLLYYDDEWIVFGILNFTGAQRYGSKTTDWCITKDYESYSKYLKDGIYVFAFNLKLKPYNIHTGGG